MTAVFARTSDASPAGRLFTPHGEHRRVITCKDGMVLVEGPAGTGKTITILNKIVACLEKYPGCRWLIIRKTRISLNETVLATFEEKVLPQDSPLLDGAERSNRTHYDWWNGSRVVVGGLDNPLRYYSGEYDGIYIPEALEVTRDEAFSLLRALRSHAMPYQQLIMDTNPGPRLHWLNVACDAGEVTRIVTTHADNPFITREYLATLDRLTGTLRARLRDGEWVSAEGTVYDLRDEHLGTALFQPDKPTQLAVDPSNGSGPYAALVLQQVGPRVLIVGEFYQVGGMDEDLRDWLLASPYYAKLTTVVCDPAKPDTIARLRAMLRVRVQAKAGRKDITAQIAAVKSLMAVDPVTHTAPLTIDRDTCPLLLDEFSRYVWRQPALSAPDRNIPEQPEDAHNHCLDALAYWVTTKALTGSRPAATTPPPTRQPSAFGQQWGRR